MKDLTLVTVNWNQQPCAELLLKSYIRHHYDGEKLKLLLVDNGSDDGSKGWLIENNIPFVSLNENVGHENALNKIYHLINTRFVLLTDTDIEFMANVFEYKDYLIEEYVSAGELIDRNFIGQEKIRDRISPWFWMFNIAKMKLWGVNIFRPMDCVDWTFDVGSWYWSKMQEFGYKNFHIHRKQGNQDNDLISMDYDKFSHWGKVSWNLDNHEDRYSEVTRRRYAIKGRLKFYDDIDLSDKFTL